jgi:hypothetical protein
LACPYCLKFWLVLVSVLWFGGKYHEICGKKKKNGVLGEILTWKLPVHAQAHCMRLWLSPRVPVTDLASTAPAASSIG